MSEQRSPPSDAARIEAALLQISELRAQTLASIAAQDLRFARHTEAVAKQVNDLVRVRRLLLLAQVAMLSAAAAAAVCAILAIYLRLGG